MAAPDAMGRVVCIGDHSFCVGGHSPAIEPQRNAANRRVERASVRRRALGLNNPLDTNYSFANAALGTFDSYTESNARYGANEGKRKCAGAIVRA